VLSVLGLAGSAAASVADWLAPLMIGLSVLLLGRAFFILYVRRRGTRASTVITWLSAIFVVGYWTWRALENGGHCSRMLDKLRNLLAVLASVAASLPW
jgi:hypothetical protein